ncbi:MAG TPA: gamma-glutamyltransferase [Alphaproteobacteria bacterium]|nr:gamma-glutamyltransferase [Alphaproteobacteria bacterium]
MRRDCAVAGCVADASPANTMIHPMAFARTFPLSPIRSPAALGAALLSALAAGCSAPPAAVVTQAPVSDYSVASGSVVGNKFVGSVASDDAQAGQVARSILQQGGTAVDAAVAAGFALAVTQPARAGLGGGGVCLATTRDRGPVRLDFRPQPLPDGRMAPMLVRGLALLHADGGTRRWTELVAPAERLARFGVAVPPRLAADIAAAPERAAALPALAGAAVGATAVQPELGAALAAVRQHGADAYVTGPLAAALAETGLPPEALRPLRPGFQPVAPQPVGDLRLVLSDPADLGAAPAADAADAAPAATVAVLDSDFRGVACRFTLGAPFGDGLARPGLGFPLAAGGGGAGGVALAVSADGRNAGAAAAADDPSALRLITSIRDAAALGAAYGSGGATASLAVCFPLASGAFDCVAEADRRGGFAGLAK